MDDPFNLQPCKLAPDVGPTSRMVSFPSSTPPPPAWSAEANQKTIRLRWNQQKMCPGWWFQTFFIFHNIWDTPSH